MSIHNLLSHLSTDECRSLKQAIEKNFIREEHYGKVTLDLETKWLPIYHSLLKGIASILFTDQVCYDNKRAEFPKAIAFIIEEMEGNPNNTSIGDIALFLINERI